MDTQRRISFSPPDITQAEIDEVVSALESGWITTGPKTKQLESDLAEYIGAVAAIFATAGVTKAWSEKFEKKQADGDVPETEEEAN